ncbi:MAG: hypothetical protein GWP08_07495 [Nitrospiraceae bacterium]|nr:hypothetical protein [Nitrospiraceae bacterium]
MGLQMKRALRIVLQTRSYVLYRVAMYAALCLFVVAYLGLLIAVGEVFGPGAFWVLLVVSVGLAVMLGLGGFVGEYVFCRLQAGHIALLSEIITEGRFPAGISQMKWVRGRVMHYFSGSGILTDVRRSLRDIIRAVNHSLFDSAAILPVPGIEGSLTFSRRIVDLAQGYVEEAAIAHAFKAKGDNMFEAARSSIVSYCQCWKVVLGNAVTLTLLGYGFALVASLLFLAPLGLASLWLVPESTMIRFTLFAVGVFLGFSAKWALFDPVASASVILTFLEESELLTPDEAWEKKLELASPEYQELVRRAGGKLASRPKRRAKRGRAAKAAGDE